jgi:hypothetical protein
VSGGFWQVEIGYNEWVAKRRAVRVLSQTALI